MMDGKNHYSYQRVKNMLNGLSNQSSKKEIAQVRKILQKEFATVDKVLADLESKQ